mmetsp:Transcript_47688/g.94393  ORF Transcript_47688/g.94393 Transcript_47688/m.94393 type:complete len:119 (-) Transcript_47688:20-376(-)|eukprot:CAMPEP_0170406590 /NCGR_PEP_ID=MMETSP0117_2-20130122/27800_1 /TAXON_ID=400756 /ORGANISM="Durinskia baltica, Strain CSIRO CS-38" /LENGTH=118 /DNA_ID=CAMNT_0010663791 /DNA_START=44 /DNA_END=400 /DNA_ORIENTATION=-
MDETSDEVTFIPESVEPICYDIIESVLKDKMYNDVMASKWIDEICSRITKELVEMNKPFKYLVSCAIMQKNGAGLHMRHSCFWDRTNDNTVIARWPSEKKKDPNARVICVLTIFGVAF